MALYTVSGKKSHSILRIDKFSHCFVIFGVNHPDTSAY